MLMESCVGHVIRWLATAVRVRVPPEPLTRHATSCLPTPGRAASQIAMGLAGPILLPTAYRIRSRRRAALSKSPYAASECSGRPWHGPEGGSGSARWRDTSECGHGDALARARGTGRLVAPEVLSHNRRSAVFGIERHPGRSTRSPPAKRPPEPHDGCGLGVVNYAAGRPWAYRAMFDNLPGCIAKYLAKSGRICYVRFCTVRDVHLT